MMIGVTHRSNPTVQVPAWDISDDPMDNILTPFSVNRHFNAVGPTGKKCSFLDVITALQRYFPSNKNEQVGSPEIEDRDIPLDAFSCDHFRIYEFKVRRCARARSHDWTECPYAHPGEKARRRDPRKFHYSGTACPDFKKGQCVRGGACEYAHGVFECWLHPARYRTQPCKDGTMCRRKVCFFAHTPDQLRVSPPSHGGILTESYDGSPSPLGIDSFIRKSSFGSTPTSILYSPPNESPPFSPCESMGSNSLSELSGSMRGLQIGEASRMSMSPAASGVQMDSSFGSPRHCSMVRPELCSLLITPPRKITRSGLGVFNLWDQSCKEEPSIQRVESGRDLRAKIYAKLSTENSPAGIDSSESGADIGWVSELLKGSC